MMEAPLIGGQQTIVLRREPSGGKRPEFTSVTLLPGRGMNVFQIFAYLPGRGEVELIASPSLKEAEKQFDGPSAQSSWNASFMMGGAFLFPFANRILGPTTPDGKAVLATWRGRTVAVPANCPGKTPGAAPQALHGLILAARADSIRQSADGSSVTATYKVPAEGRWFTDNQLTVEITLEADALTVQLTGTNTGNEAEPVGIGWHPYFRILGNDREKVRLHLPAAARAAVNNPQQMLPTGKSIPVAGTTFDFRAPEGAPLTGPLNDTFLDLQHGADGQVECGFSDPGADYSLKMIAFSRQVHAMVAYAPVGQSLIVLEPQFNLPNPFGPEWAGQDNGMVTLAPGEQVHWKVRLELGGAVQ